MPGIFKNFKSLLTHYVGNALKVFLALPAIALAYIVPRTRKRIVAGAWHGRLYADNSKYFVEWLLAHTDIKVTWVGNEEVKELLPKHPRLSFAKKDSCKAWFSLLRSKYSICSCMAKNDLSSYNVRGLSTIIDPWHGTPLKRIGALSNNGGYRDSLLGRLYTKYILGSVEWATVSNERMKQFLADGFPGTFSRKKMLSFGTPRCDFLVANRNNAGLVSLFKEKVRKMLGIDGEKRIVAYLPTWRGPDKSVFTFYGLPEETQNSIKNLLDSADAVLVEQHHFHTYERFTPPDKSTCSNVVTFDKKRLLDAQELLLATDILICDYSGAYIDYGLLGRPCIHFAYDLEEYSNEDSGLAYDLGQVAAGPIVQTLPELLTTLSELLARPVFNPAPHYHEIVEYEKGHACEQLARFMGLKTHE